MLEGVAVSSASSSSKPESSRMPSASRPIRSCAWRATLASACILQQQGIAFNDVDVRAAAASRKLSRVTCCNQRFLVGVPGSSPMFSRVRPNSIRLRPQSDEFLKASTISCLRSGFSTELPICDFPLSTRKIQVLTRSCSRTRASTRVRFAPVSCLRLPNGQACFPQRLSIVIGIGPQRYCVGQQPKWSVVHRSRDPAIV